MNTYDINSNDPMEVIWAVREQINEETKDMSWEEFHEYVRKGSERGRKEIERNRKRPLPNDPPPTPRHDRSIF